jgi:hypothetical protein
VERNMRALQLCSFLFAGDTRANVLMGLYKARIRVYN